MTTTHLQLTRLEDRDVPATLDIVSGQLTFLDADSENNNLTVAVSGGVYAFKDTATVVSLGSGAVSEGWKGDGTSTVSGPASSVDSIEIYLGGGANTANIKSVLDPILIDGGSGASQVNLNSVAPIHIGNLSGIQATVTVNAGDNTSLMASDYTGSVRPNPVVISATGITGLAPHAINLSGTLNTLKVYGSNNVNLAEAYSIDAPDAMNFQLFTGNGADEVEVIAWDAGCTGTFNGGSGTADSLTILDGITVYGTASGFETENFNLPGYGDLM